MQVKKGKMMKITKWLAFLPAIAIVLMCLTTFLPSMGMKVLRYKILKYLSFAFLGLAFAVTGAESLWRDEQANTTYGRPRRKSLEEVYENRRDHTGLMGIIALLGGIALLFYGGSKVAACVQDAKTGPVQITLESTGVGDKEQADKEDNNVSAYDLYGVANLEFFTFRIDGDEMNEMLTRRINYLSPEITVVYYPRSKAIVQVQIFFDENDKVVLPYGERAYDSKSLEKLPEGKGEAIEDVEAYKEYTEAVNEPTPTPGPFVPMRQEYSDVAIEDLGLPEIKIGDDYITVAQELAALPAGECYEMIFPGNDKYEEYFQDMINVKKKYELTEQQRLDILYKDDIELIIIYDAETRAIEEVFARRSLVD